MSAILEPTTTTTATTIPAPRICARRPEGADGCPMTSGGSCPSDQRVIDKCNEC